MAIDSDPFRGVPRKNVSRDVSRETKKPDVKTTDVASNVEEESESTDE
jgi:hypothetical protein